MSEATQFVKVTESAQLEVGAFYEGEVRRVTDEVAGLLIGNGWAETTEVELIPRDVEVTPEPVTLEVDNSTMGTTAEEVK